MWIAGIDEVGRGCIAGPVIAAIVVIHPDRPILGLKDSKRLSPKRRAVLAQTIQQHAAAWAIGRAEPGEIDRLNIHHATLLAMQRAYRALDWPVERVNIDGKFIPPNLPCPAHAIVQGDSLYAEISAASIIAKVWRDREMAVMDALWPGYDFTRHKGYPTLAHHRALDDLGPAPCHRASFAPVRLAQLHLPF